MIFKRLYFVSMNNSLNFILKRIKSISTKASVNDQYILIIIQMRPWTARQYMDEQIGWQASSQQNGFEWQSFFLVSQSCHMQTSLINIHAKKKILQYSFPHVCQ